MPRQALEAAAAAELTSKHCIDLSLLVPDEFAADTETFTQRMPQVLLLLARHGFELSFDVTRSCWSMATSC